MKKQLLTLLLTVGCIPAIIEQEAAKEKGVQITQDDSQETSLVCKNCRRKK